MSTTWSHRLLAIDSHTGGEPTRVVIEGGPDLGDGPLVERRARFRRDFDRFRSAVVNEPRGSDIVVGALLLEPFDRSCEAGVIFFNNVGYLGMCGHGTIGLLATLAYLGRVTAGEHRIETPVGVITATLHSDGEVSVTNVASFRRARGIMVDVPQWGHVPGDVAWGGNWFFLTHAPPDLWAASDVTQLTGYATRIRRALHEAGYPDVDHIELSGPPTLPEADAKNFVLCPGNAYDRSPCGTGTSAKLACLALDGQLAPGEPWVQESIIGSTFVGRYCWEGEQIIPTITGRAYVSAESTLLIDERDCFGWGIRR